MKFVKVGDEVVSVELSLRDVGEIGRALSESQEDSRSFVLGTAFRGVHERMTQAEGEDPMPEDGVVVV